MTERTHEPDRPQTVPTLTDVVQAQQSADATDAANDAQQPIDASLQAAAPADMPVPLAQIPTLMPEPQAEAALRTSRYIERALNAVGRAASSDAAPQQQPSQPEPPQPEPPAGPGAPAWLGPFDDLQPLHSPGANGLLGLQDGALPHANTAPTAPGQPLQAPPARDAASELAERVAWEMLQLGQTAPAQPALPQPPVVAALPDAAEEPLPAAADDVQAAGFCAVAARAAQADAWPDTAALRGLLPGDFEEQLVHRVMQRVDAVLTDRVGEVIAAVIERQTRSLLPSIREELEFAIRKSVYEAMAEELAGIQASGVAGKPQ